MGGAYLSVVKGRIHKPIYKNIPRGGKFYDKNKHKVIGLGGTGDYFRISRQVGAL